MTFSARTIILICISVVSFFFAATFFYLFTIRILYIYTFCILFSISLFCAVAKKIN